MYIADCLLNLFGSLAIYLVARQGRIPYTHTLLTRTSHITTRC